MDKQKYDNPENRSAEEWSHFLEKEAATILEEHHAPGVAVLLVTPESSIGFEKCWGLAKVEPAVPLELDTPVRAGSISKIITAIAVRQLVESGDLTLETKIGGLLDWPLPYNYGQATLGGLLTHRAGIGERFARQSTPRAAEIAGLCGYLQKNLPPPVANVAETVTYSNFGISLAGLAVEKITGQSFAVYAGEKIFQPLGMQQATFIPDEKTERELAGGYNWIFGRHRPLAVRHWKPYPASSLVATPRELGQLIRLFLNPERTSAVLARPEALLEEQFSPLPGVPGMGLSFWLDEIEGQRVAWHTGHMPGHRTGFYIFPRAGFGIFLYYNNDKKVLRPFLDKTASFAFSKSTEEQKRSCKKTTLQPANGIENFCGIYRHSWYPHHHFGKSSAMLGKEGEEVKVVFDAAKNRLTVSGENYEHEERDIFKSSQRGTRIGFIRGQANRISGLYAGGRDRYEKISLLESRAAHIGYGIVCITLFSIGGILFIINAFNDKETLFLPSAINWGLLITCAANLGFFSAMAILTARGAYKVTEAVPISVGLTLSLPILGALSCLLTLGRLTLNGFPPETLTLTGLIAITLTTTTEVLFLWFLNYWKLLGWRY